MLSNRLARSGVLLIWAQENCRLIISCLFIFCKTWVTNSFSWGCLSAPGMLKSAATALIADLRSWYFVFISRGGYLTSLDSFMVETSWLPFELILLLIFLLYTVGLDFGSTSQLQRLYKPRNGKVNTDIEPPFHCAWLQDLKGWSQPIKFLKNSTRTQLWDPALNLSESLRT